MCSKELCSIILRIPFARVSSSSSPRRLGCVFFNSTVDACTSSPIRRPRRCRLTSADARVQPGGEKNLTVAFGDVDAVPVRGRAARHAADDRGNEHQKATNDRKDAAIKGAKKQGHDTDDDIHYAKNAVTARAKRRHEGSGESNQKGSDRAELHKSQAG